MKMCNSLIFGLFLLTVFFGCKNNQEKNLNILTDDTKAYENPKWAKDLIKAYQAFNSERNVESANLVFDASEQMPKKNWENYFVCATVFAPNNEKEKAYLSIDKAIESGLRDTELLGKIPELNSLKNNLKWDALISKANRKKEEYIRHIKNPQLLNELKVMWSKDQQALEAYEKNASSLGNIASSEDYKRLFEPVEIRWEINKRKLDSIIEIYGWPGNNLVGEDGAKIAWSIAQHYPDVFFKKKCLALIKEEVKKENVSPNHYAELNDRIARDTWQKQIYGASMGEKAPHPIENVIQVNKRRLELGLFEPVEVYALYHGIDFQIPDQQQTQAIHEKAQADYEKFENLIDQEKIDSAQVHIRKAIKAHGNISNDQLFIGAIKLAQTRKEGPEIMSVKILKVLIWREWEKRFDIITEPRFNSLHKREEWVEIQELLERSKKLRTIQNKI